MCIAGFFIGSFALTNCTDCEVPVIAAGPRFFRGFRSDLGFVGMITEDAVLGDRRSCGVGVEGFLLLDDFDGWPRPDEIEEGSEGS